MTLEVFLAHPVVQALGRALLHFLWQGLLLALVVYAVKIIAPSAAARLRYTCATLILFMMPLVLILTATQNRQHEPIKTQASPRSTPAHARTGASQAAVLYAPTAAALRPGIWGWAVCVWIAGVLVLSMRAAAGWKRAQRLKGLAQPADTELESMLQRLATRLGVFPAVRLCTSAIVQVPMVIGWIRPCILLPVTMVTGLNESQIKAILTHELAHIRRYDYLVNLLQTAIETVLFYHPAVWWVGKQMRIEREHCCDDIAVTVCGNPIEYAGALAELEELRCSISEPAVAATGGELLGRIRRLLGQQDNSSRSSGAVAAAALVVLIISVVSLYAAPQEAAPAFDVASIKRDVSGESCCLVRRMVPTLHFEKITLRVLVMMAYRVQRFEITEGPDWIDADRYNIDATAERPPALNREYADLQDRRLQTMLRDRFNLRIHRETKERPVYELTVAKGGPKLQLPNCIRREPGDTTITPGKTPADYCGPVQFGRGQLEASSATLEDFATVLALPLGRRVVDRTGIKGDFHIMLAYSYAPDEPRRPPHDPTGPGFANGAAEADSGPDIFAALQEQLGLKLNAAKAPVEVLIIDHVEKPSEN